MNELDIATITRRSIRGIFALVSRTFLIQVIGQGVSFLLTIYLFPAEYGIFFIASSVIVFLSYFSDVGLAAALIQKKEPLTDDDLKTTFTIQQILVVSLVIIGFLLSGFVAQIYHLDQAGLYLYQALIIAFFLSSLKTIPSIILERNLQFQKLVIPEIIETLVFNITILVLAIQGYGIASFAYGVLARGAVGLIAMYLIAPWRIRIGYVPAVGKRLLSFGVPFQANSVLALLKDQLLVLYLGIALSPVAVGYIGVAQKWAFTPLRLFMDNVIRITFPSFSRMASDKTNLGKAIEKTLFATAFFIFPSLATLVLLMPSFMKVFPTYQKWEPALASLFFFGINACFSSVSTPLTNALNAIGKIKVTLFFMIGWTVATWILTPLGIILFGFDGVAIASAAIASGVVIVVSVVKRHIPFSIMPVIVTPTIATGILIGFYLLAEKYIVSDLWTFALTLILGAAVYLGSLLLIAKEQIISDTRMIMVNLKR